MVPRLTAEGALPQQLCLSSLQPLRSLITCAPLWQGPRCEANPPARARLPRAFKVDGGGVFAAMFTPQSCPPAQAAPKPSLGISKMTSRVAVGCCFMQVVAQVFEVTVMGEILNRFSNDSSAVTLQNQLALSARSPSSLGWLVYTRLEQQP